MRRFAAMLLVGALGALPARSGSEPQVVERVIATVGSEVITLSRLELESRVELVLRGGREAALAPLPHDVLADNLSYAIGQRLAQTEANKLGVFEIEQTELDAAVNEFSSQLAPVRLDKFLEANEVTIGEFQRLLRRDLQASKYLTSRAQLRAPLDEAAVDAFLAAHASELGSAPSRQVREEVRARLVRERNGQLVQAELRRLYARAKVRIVDPGFADADHALRSEPTGGG